MATPTPPADKYGTASWGDSPWGGSVNDPPFFLLLPQRPSGSIDRAAALASATPTPHSFTIKVKQPKG